MKKQYKAPFIVVESFQLDAAIAGSCSGSGMTTVGHGSKDCPYDTNGDGVQFYFDDGYNSTCNANPLWFMENNGYCYDATLAGRYPESGFFAS